MNLIYENLFFKILLILFILYSLGCLVYHFKLKSYLKDHNLHESFEKSLRENNKN